MSTCEYIIRGHNFGTNRDRPFPFHIYTSCDKTFSIVDLVTLTLKLDILLNNFNLGDNFWTRRHFRWNLHHVPTLSCIGMQTLSKTCSYCPVIQFYTISIGRFTYRFGSIVLGSRSFWPIQNHFLLQQMTMKVLSVQTCHSIFETRIIKRSRVLLF